MLAGTQKICAAWQLGRPNLTKCCHITWQTFNQILHPSLIYDVGHVNYAMTVIDVYTVLYHRRLMWELLLE